MFRKSPSDRKIELTCPYCGNRQQEPAAVISSFCQACSEHFRVRKGLAIPNPGIRVSGIVEFEPKSGDGSDDENDVDTGSLSSGAKPPPDATESSGTSPEVDEDAWLISADDAERPRPLDPEGADASETDEEGISAGAFFGLVHEDFDEDAGNGKDMEQIGGKARGKETLAEGSMAALIESQAPTRLPETDKMPPNFKEPAERRKSGDHSSQLGVRCFRCYHVQPVSRFAKSTQCERCSVYISLANYEVTRSSRHTLRTRGDISIGKRGSLRKCEIACHNLTVHGTIDARIDCSGLAVFRGSGIARGHLYCRKLLVEKGASIAFPDGVMTEQAEILGTVEGDITCSGSVRVARSASIEGNVRACSIELKDGASISGDSKIDPDTRTDLPVKMGFNPSVIG